ncbi:LTA synthase family protein [Mucilaginibacter psychrotolerans]|uniref:Alkaline phosphatase family protein n=1 Tax=Mucilaginibacter psychrotolerans TaxID=1524096 RepID=A0A4Y8SNB3_9SPHI|nr:alkaline phosphatase family protein [Mucilaginibacter psychrotolerans]TFF40609.1 alkaline phosphatase family protein [Mucilaginibacter psychrotolerans]
MLKTVFSFCRFLIFWIVFAFITRAVFEVYFHEKFEGSTAWDIIQTFIYGARMDASMAGYIALIPLLVFGFNWFTKYHIKPIWLCGYVYFMLFLVCFIAILNFNIFREWGTKVNFRVFANVYNSPSEAMASTGSSPIGISLSIGAVLLTVGILLSHFIIDYNFRKPKVPLWTKPLIFLLLFGVNFVIVRSGLQLVPMSQSTVYFSDRPILNQGALNTEWNLMQNTFESVKTQDNPYLFMPAARATALVDSMYAVNKDTTINILTTPRPNVVIIQLESFTADVIQSLGGEKGDAPNFEDFIKNGVLFDSIYAASDRTDKGIVAILSAFPSQASRTMVIDNSKQEHLPAISNSLINHGYHTSYFYGGDANFMNFKAYLLSHNIDGMIDKFSFDEKEMNSKWGAHDDIVLKRNVIYLSQQKEPFFSYIQTLSNHEPFEVPTQPHFPGEDLPNKFRSTAYYTDASLKEYFDEAKKQPWYKNTLFILVADHGHRLPLNHSEPYEPRKYHIPLLFFGDAIKPEYRGKHITKLGNQVDIATTLLTQMGLPHKEFKWSKNLLNPYSKEFAFFDWDNGMGFMTPNQAVSYDNAGQRVNYIKNPAAPKAETDETLLLGKAFLQEVFTEYMKF